MPRLSYSTGLFSFFIHGGKNGRLANHMRMRYLWLVAVLGLIPSFSYAQTATVSPVGISSASINSSGNVVAMHTYRATYAGQPDSYYSRAVTYNKATTGKLGKARAFVKGNALNLGIVAGTLALGYVLDEITKDIYPNGQQGSPSITCNPHFTVSTSMGGSTKGCTISTAISAHLTQCNSINSGSSFAPGYCVLPSATAVGTYNGAHYFSQRFNSQVMAGTMSVTQTATSYTQPAIPGTPATDSQLHDAMFPQPMWENNGYLGDSLPELLRDPLTGATELTQEVQDVATQIQNQHTAQYNPTATPVTSPTVDPNYTSTPNNPAPTAFPSFCSWASRVCEFFDWYSDEPPEPPTADWSVAGMITEEELEMQSYSSGLGNGSCPADETFSVYGVSLSYSYAPMCDLASTAKIFVILGAYLLSIFIVLGIRR